MTELSGYVFSALRGGEFTLYRGAGDGLDPILLVTPIGEFAVRESLKRLEHEHDLKAELDAEWAVRPLALSRHEGRMALVLEDPGGEPLDHLLGDPMDVTQFLRIAIPLAASIGQVHMRGLIHKNLKPANILVDVASGGVWLTGFGIASRLPREHQAATPPEVIAGTLAYMAPEQTGRMNRSIDTRSDLYSLGITFYEMLTGTLPFTAADPMEWVHCHIARQPKPPDERVAGIPGPLAAIVMKLLAKTAEGRYQTAAGLAVDLRRCLAEWEAARRIEPFALGAQDASDHLLIPERLYGREREIDTLVAAFDRVVTRGATELVLVSGHAGIGKSSLVNELHKQLVPSRGLFASGKFDQYKRNIPYATLAQAFHSLVDQILSKSNAEMSRWRSALLDALGPNGQLMVNLIPELALIIGEQSPVPELPPQDAKNRFQMVFRRFLGMFARPEHPLALFLDDLQWLDSATLDLIEHLVVHPEVRHLLLVGAYRDNEVGPAHPLKRTLEAIRGAGASVQEIVLAPLMPDDVARLLADALHTQHERARPLADLVFEKTAGNPFFTIQFLLALADEALLAFDPGLAAWTWDLPRIRAKGFTDNVADLMAAKLSRLPPATRKALGQLACLGNVAETTTLTLVHGGAEEAMHAALWEAVRSGLVVRSDSTYTFLHDRIQEAAYGLIAEDERAIAHLRIGRMLAERTTPEALEENIFDIVNQFDRGAALITSQDEREQVAGLNLMAGKRAKAATAYAAALQYLSAGRTLLAQSGWEKRYRLSFDLDLNCAECQYLTGELAAAEELLTMLSLRAQTSVDSAAVASVRINLYTNLDQSDGAVEVGLEYLRGVDGRWSAHPTEEDVRQAYSRLWQRLGSRSIEALLDLPPMSDTGRSATMDVLSALASPALFTDLNLFRLVVSRMATLSLEYGNSDGSCYAYVCLGGILGTYFGDYPAGFRFGRLGLDLLEKRGLDRHGARVYLVFAAHVAPWTQHLPSCRIFLRRAFEAAQRAGDLTHLAYSCADLITNRLASGDPLDDVEREASNALEFVQKLRFGLISDIITPQLRLIRAFRGLTSDFNSFNDADFDEVRFEQRLDNNPQLAIAASHYRIRKLQACVYAGDGASAVAAALKVAPLLGTVPTQVELSEYHFYAALARAAGCDMAPAEERPRHLEALTAHHRQIALWAKNCPATFANRAALVGAEIARLEGRELEAMSLYEEAIKLAREHGFIQNEGLAHEVAARFYAARGLETIADAYLRNAWSCYLHWGADGKVRQLEQLHPHLREESAPPPPTATFGTSVEQLDVGTVVKASQAVSGEIELGRLIETLMRIALEHAGAERGLLILLSGDEPQIVAEATAGQGRVEVTVREAAAIPSALPLSALHYVIRTRESVVLDDASVRNLYSDDEYVRQKHPRSVLCLPVVKQTKLAGALYLENNLTPYAFTSSRVAVLELLASQAAISLENARLYFEIQRENTERKRAEKDLRRSEAYLAEAQRLSRTGSFGWSVATGQVIWSDETFRIFGYDKAPSVNLDLIVRRIHPDDSAGAQQIIDRAARDGKDFSHEYRLLMPDGSVKYIHAVGHALKDASGNIEFVGAVTDVTTTKQAYEALERSEQRYRRLFHHMPVALLQVNVRARLELLKGLRDEGVEDVIAYLDQNPDFLHRVLDAATVEDANQRAVQMLGARDTSQLIGSSASFYWEEGPATFRRSLESRFRGELTFQEEARFTTLDGRAVDVLITIARSDASSEAGMNLVGLIDISERVRAQEMLQRAQADLAHVTRVTTLGELTASIAHEVNQPLAAVVTNGEVCLRWLARGVPDLAEVREAVGDMISNGRRASEIVRRLRALSERTETQKLAVDINDVISEVIPLVQHEVLSHRVSLRLVLAPMLPAVLGDRVQLQQVIINLIVNGMEAMAPITDRLRELVVRSQLDEGGQVLIAVEDSGTGIDPENAKQLFNAFFTTKPRGMGMGLSICRSIIENHGGRLWASPNAGPGATFQFTLQSHPEARP